MALAEGSLVFLAVLILFLVGVIIALYTRRGSGVDLHPYRHTYGGAPAAALPCDDYSGSDRTSVTERDVVRSWRRRRLDQSPASVAAQVAEARAQRRQQASQPRTNRLPIRSPLGPPR
jgi:hypothetical protein